MEVKHLGDLGSFVLGFGEFYPTLFFPGTAVFVEFVFYCDYGDANLQKFLTQADWELRDLPKHWITILCIDLFICTFYYCQ